MMHGKAICYAEKPLLITRPFLDWVQTINLEHGTWPQLADIPQVGSSIGQGQPVLTVFTSGTDLEQVENQLQLKMAALKQQLNK
jgi:predicted ATP-grasp superfamily ATP-dependent carboligase